MKWLGRRQSDNVDDRRGSSGGKIALGGGVIGIVVLVINMLMGGDPTELLNSIQQQQGPEQTRELTEQEQQQGVFIKTLLADNEDIWAAIFKESGQQFEPAKLVLFRDGVNTDCGGASSASGPFYCPEDRTIYMDLAFFDELQSKYGAQGGEFTVAYVMAHEYGHHIQTLIGTSDRMRERQQQGSEKEANRLSVALELQADFYAGIWTYHNDKKNNIIEAGDIEQAISAANAIGDDAIQRKTQGQIVPDSFTHGTSQQRIDWFMKGYTTGDLKQGDTFGALNLEF